MPTFSYIPHTEEDRRHMMNVLGITNIAELFADIPETVRMTRGMDLPKAMSEIELNRHMKNLSDRNRNIESLISFLGAGCYEHYQPSVVDAIISRSEFYTSYTPYQPEISQGMLQAIFEYQTLATELTGMDVANASMYDGATALSEAGIVCCAHTKRNKLLVASGMHPEYRSVLRTYANGQSIEVVEIPSADGVIDMEALQDLCDKAVAGVLVQYPNFFGSIENLQSMANIAHECGALFVVSAYPISLGLLKSPGEQGADIVVAEGQSLGNSMSYGGPYLGIMAAKSTLMRRLPGRIVGQTTDSQGRRGFVLTLQAREQHIRREKATSNICSNQALNALAATVFLSYLGPNGIRELALQNYHKAHYLHRSLCTLPGITSRFSSPFFNEFVIRFEKSVTEIQDLLLQKGYLFGLSLGRFDEALSDALLVTVTEMRTREEMDALCRELEGIL